MLYRALSVCLLSVPLMTSSVLAHGDAPHSAVKAAHGGQLQAAGSYQLELVVKKDSPQPRDNPVVLYLTDHDGKNLSAAGASGTVTLLTGKEKVVVPLKADGDNRLTGTGKYASDPAMKALASVTVGGKTEQARFTPLQASDGHTDHQH